MSSDMSILPSPSPLSPSADPPQSIWTAQSDPSPSQTVHCRPQKHSLYVIHYTHFIHVLSQAIRTLQATETLSVCYTLYTHYTCALTSRTDDADERHSVCLNILYMCCHRLCTYDATGTHSLISAVGVTLIFCCV